MSRVLSWAIFVLFVCSSFNDSVEQSNPTKTFQWNYERQGPDVWHHAAAICDGDSQSPIDIDTKRVKYDVRLTALSLHAYQTNASVSPWNFTHDGHTIVVYPPTTARLSVSGANLPEVFHLVHFQLHWGYNCHQGSEHTINGRKYSLEIQFVHRSADFRATAILSILFERQSADNPYLNDFLSIINQTTHPSVFVEQPLDLSVFLPSNPAMRFYRYNGSLTTPPCTEGVHWIVLARTVPISSRQVGLLINNTVAFNYRPTQKLHQRQVLANFPQETSSTVDEHIGRDEHAGTSETGGHGQTHEPAGHGQDHEPAEHGQTHENTHPSSSCWAQIRARVSVVGCLLVTLVVWN
jgi:carbonic anhydrase